MTKAALIPPSVGARNYLVIVGDIQRVENGIVAGVSVHEQGPGRSVRMGGDLCFMRTAGTARELVDAFH